MDRKIVFESQKKCRKNPSDADRQAAVESGLKDQKSNLSFSDCSGTEDRRKKIPIFQKDSDTVLLFLCHYDIIFMKK